MFDINNVFTHDGSGGLVQAVSGDAASTNLIDLNVANLNIAGGKKGTYLIVKSTVAAQTMTSLEIALETDTDSGFATAKKQVGIWNIVAATMTAGATLINQVLPVQKYQRYIRLYFNVINSGTVTIFAALSDGPEAAVNQIDLVGA